VTKPDGIFSGLKVLDIASFIAAPAAATILSDFGADVIKIEPPGAGDPYRALANGPGLPQAADNYCWTLDARNKRSLVLDLKTPEGQQVLHRLVAAADVLITNFPLQVRDRLGLAYEQLVHINPRLIYTSFTAYGETGPEANTSGFDSTAWWARSGLMSEVLPDSDSSPARSVPGMGDHPTAMALYAAIVTALYRRERTGQGALVGSSLLANGAWSNSVMIQAALGGAEFPKRPVRTQSLNALRNHYLCRDGRWFMLSLVQEDKHFGRFVAKLGHPELNDDPRFATTPARHDNAAALTAALDAAFAERDSADWVRRLGGEGFTISQVARHADAATDPQMLAIGAVVPMADPAGGKYTVDSPFWVRGETKVAPRPAPALGQHTEEVLREYGFTPDDIALMRKNRTVA
jgi:crotonobetainyl-CoA:carnitine CoA-transferase CaiB-like acyl-CoA transferase